MLENSGIQCPCCGYSMAAEAVHEKHIVYKCSKCGLSDIKVKNP